jgi:hypothetical protein
MSETEAGDLHLEFEGFYDVCFRKHIPSDVIDEISLTDGTLSNYDVVILPNMACMSDAEMDAVREFVRNGGTLVSTFETSLFNEYGEKRQQFGLADVFGCRLADEKIYGPLSFDYIMPSEDENAYSRKLSDYVYIPVSKYLLKTLPDTAQSIMDCAELMEGRYDGFPDRSPNGFMYMNSYGKGKSFYFSGTLGQALIEWHFFEHFDIVEKTIKDNSTMDISITEGAESISLNVRKNKETGEILIYLTNFTGNMTRPVRQVNPLFGVKLETSLPVRGIRTLMTEGRAKLEIQGEKRIITLDRLDEFEVIVLTI